MKSAPIFLAGIAIGTTSTLALPPSSAAFKRVSAMECTADTLPSTINASFTPPLGFQSTLGSTTPGTGVICPLSETGEHPNTAITAIETTIRDNRFGSSGLDNDFSIKACKSFYLASSSCGAAYTTVYDPGNITASLDVSEVQTSATSFSYVYVDLPAAGNVSGSESWFTGYKVTYQ